MSESQLKSERECLFDLFCNDRLNVRAGLAMSCMTSAIFSIGLDFYGLHICMVKFNHAANHYEKSILVLCLMSFPV